MNKVSRDLATSKNLRLEDAIRLGRPVEPLVAINVAVCKSLAAFVENHRIPMDEEDTCLPGFSRTEIGNFYLFLVAICHQTSPIGKPALEGLVHGAHKRGWDYLSAKLAEVFRSRRELFSPREWVDLKEKDLEELLRDPQFGYQLNKPKQRVALVRDLGEVMLSNSWVWAEDLYSLSCGRVATGHPNLLELLVNFKAYRDPVRKKSYFFLSLMQNAGVWKYADAHHLGPPVDYHETRGHLRLGTVIVRNQRLRKKLLNNLPVTEIEDRAIRQAVHDAIILISDLSGLRNPSQLHYLFWNVFRSCCSRESPHCLGCPPDCPLPDRYVPLAMHGGQRSCPFSAMCGNKCATSHKIFYEQRFDTDYY